MKTANEKNMNPAEKSDALLKYIFSPLFKARFKLVLIIFVLYVILNVIGAGCPIKFLSGLSCPGCGMTRAIKSLLILDFTKAFYYHPLFPITPFMLYLFLFEDRIKPKYVKVGWAGIVILFLITYIIRLFISNHSVVSIDFTSGFVLRWIHNNILGG